MMALCCACLLSPVRAGVEGETTETPQPAEQPPVYAILEGEEAGQVEKLPEPNNTGKANKLWHEQHRQRFKMDRAAFHRIEADRLNETREGEPHAPKDPVDPPAAEVRELRSEPVAQLNAHLGQDKMLRTLGGNHARRTSLPKAGAARPPGKRRDDLSPGKRRDDLSKGSSSSSSSGSGSDSDSSSTEYDSNEVVEVWSVKKKTWVKALYVKRDGRMHHVTVSGGTPVEIQPNRPGKPRIRQC